MANREASRHGRCPARWNAQIAVAQPITIGSRLEALAITGSTPIMIITGIVTADPLDAAVFRNAAATPARMRITASITGSTTRAASCPLLTQG